MPQPEENTEPEIQEMDPRQIGFSQVDITETFDDNERLKPEDWVQTVPLNKMVASDQAGGLPLVDATDEQIYAIAEKMSRIRESVLIPKDGVYCPVCHIANTQQTKLSTPCPKCGRPLLKFGWD